MLLGCFLYNTNPPCNEIVGGSGMDPLGLPTLHWIIQAVIDRKQLKTSRRHMGPIFSSILMSRAKSRRWTKNKVDLRFLNELINC